MSDPVSIGQGLNPFVDFTAGTIAGISALVVGYPFDTVKVRFQNVNTSDRYRSTFDAFSTILRDEGLKGLYEGISSPLATCALLNGLTFAAYGFFTKLLLTHPQNTLTLFQIAIAGAGTGLVISFFNAPVELIKVQQQVFRANGPDVPPALTVIRDIYAMRGLAGLYHGLSTTMIRELNCATYFYVYEGTCRLFSVSTSASASWQVVLLAGGVAGVAAWVSTFPFDLAKTRIQSVPCAEWVPAHNTMPSAQEGAAPPKAPGAECGSTRAALAEAYREEGWPVFFRGLAPTVMRAFPVNAANFVMYEVAKRVMS